MLKSRLPGAVGIVAARRLTIALLLMPLTLAAQGQAGALVGRWVPLGDLPPVIWDFNEDGSATETLTVGGLGTYRLEGNRLSLMFEDQSTGTAEVSIAGDTMVWTSVVGPALVITGAIPPDWRLTRVGPTSREAAPIIGTWKMPGRSGSGSFQLWEFLRGDMFRLREGNTGTWTLADNIVTIRIGQWYTTGRTLLVPPQSYRLTGQGPGGTLTPVNESFRLPALRRAPAAPADLQTELTDANTAFTYVGDPINPLAVRDLLTALTDHAPGPVAIDLAGTRGRFFYGSNRYFVSQPYKIGSDGAVSVDMKDTAGGLSDRPRDGGFMYKRIGALPSGVHVLQTWDNGGGSGTFASALFVKFGIDSEYGADDQGQIGRRDRLLIMRVGEVTLESAAETVAIKGNTVEIGPDSRGTVEGKIVLRFD